MTSYIRSALGLGPSAQEIATQQFATLEARGRRQLLVLRRLQTLQQQGGTVDSRKRLHPFSDKEKKELAYRIDALMTEHQANQHVLSEAKTYLEEKTYRDCIVLTTTALSLIDADAGALLGKAAAGANLALAMKQHLSASSDYADKLTSSDDSTLLLEGAHLANSLAGCYFNSVATKVVGYSLSCIQALT